MLQRLQTLSSSSLSHEWAGKSSERCSMSRPTILTVDDDPQVSAAISRDLTTQYGADYRIIRTSSGREALDVLTKLALRDDALAYLQRNPPI